MMLKTNIIGIFNRTRENKADRPTERPEMSPFDWLLEIMSIIGLIAFFGYVLYQFPKLPESIPSHFNGAGMPDEYSSKSSIWFLPGIGLFVYILLTLIILVPHQFNYAVKITQQNAMKQYTMAIRLVRYLKMAVIYLFFYIGMMTFRVAGGESTGLGLWFIPVVLGWILIPLIIYLVKSFGNK